MKQMPDLCTPRRGFQHNLDSAHGVLRRLGVEPERIRVESAGPGWHPGTVLHQSPAPGAPLGPRTRVVLTVAGAGGLDLLPYPLRDEDDADFRADRLMALFDNPLHKLALHVRQAGGFLALHPDDLVVTRRWIEEIFQLLPGPIPQGSWYPLARFLPALHRVAGTAAAVELAFRLVLGLPVAEVRTLPGVVPFPPGGRTRLGETGSRLGVDTVAGEGVIEHSVLEVTFGPLDLAGWRLHTAPGCRAERDVLYHLVLPYRLRAAVRERWAVGDASSPARLGDPASEPLLGVNARLGASPDRSAA
ncbi:MAG TPA: type VI secretion system baseplate subunit TssG [Longimicrobiaceae bacterium]|nr:type VI secretion system baseplate subunit TssG [Longimicrobiaceae bacterium]